jgi:hypothetical protein
MSVELPQLPSSESTEKTPPCRMLRTKTAFGFVEEAETPWYESESTTAVYWCLGTMETAGPDDMYCHPKTCRAGRTCYQPELG